MPTFDPLKHPRNRLGEFRRVLRALPPGEKLRVPGGITLERRDNGQIKVKSPGHPPVELAPDRAVMSALHRSAALEHPQSIGGRTKLADYDQFRKAEVAARKEDPEWADVDPDMDDEEDLFERPLAGDRERNWTRLDDIRREAELVLEDDPDPDEYVTATERLERANAGLQAIEDAVEIPESPGAVASRDWGVAKSEFRDAEIEYLSALMDGRDALDAKRRRDDAKARMENADLRVGRVWKGLGSQAAKRLNARDA